jgi:hypothetical protein
LEAFAATIDEHARQIEAALAGEPAAQIVAA